MATKGIQAHMAAIVNAFREGDEGRDILVLETDLVAPATRVEVQMGPYDFRVVVDTITGKAQPPKPPFQRSDLNPLLPNPNYPIAGAPLDLCLPSMADAAGKIYVIEGFLIDGTNDVNIIDKEMGSTLLTLTTPNEVVVLYCPGVTWEQVTTTNLI